MVDLKDFPCSEECIERTLVGAQVSGSIKMGAGKREIHQRQAHNWRAYPIWPYGSHVKIATWNILHGMAVPEGVVHNERVAERAAQLDVDLLALQEVDFFQERSHHVDQSAMIAQAMRAPFISRGIALQGTPGEKWEKFSEQKITKDAHWDFKERVGESVTPYYGNAIVSRIPIVEEFRLDLGRSKVGAPLAIPQTPPDRSRPKIKLIYIHDEPRVAHAVYLENGITIINTHLSFVPGMNIFQLRKIHHWAKSLPGRKVLVGDLNLPGRAPAKIMKWRSAAEQFTYPSWGARIQFDHILLADNESRDYEKLEFPQSTSIVSDHLPLGIEWNLSD